MQDTSSEWEKEGGKAKGIRIFLLRWKRERWEERESERKRGKEKEGGC